jgi:SET family sugar efflux transporter-like MFS transporter
LGHSASKTEVIQGGDSLAALGFRYKSASFRYNRRRLSHCAIRFYHRMSTPAPTSASLFGARTLLIYLLTLLLGGMYALVAPTLSFYLADHFQLRPLAVGGFFVAVAVANILYSQGIARWSDRIQQRHGLILAGMLTGGLACFAFAKAQNYWWVLIAGITLFSLSNAVLPQIFALSREYADRCLPAHQTTLFNAIVRACIALAWVGAPPTGFFLQSWVGFERQYLAVGAGYILVGLAAYRFLPRIPKSHQSPPATQALLGNAAVILAILAFALLFGANQTYVLALPMLVSRELGAEAQMAGWLMGTAAALEIPIMLLAGWLAARYRLLSIVRFGCGAGIVLYYCVWQAGHMWQMFALQLLNATFVGCVAGVGITLFQNLLPGRAGLGSTLFTNANQLGNIFGSLAIAIVADLQGYRDLYGFNALVAALAFVILIQLDRRTRA